MDKTKIPEELSRIRNALQERAMAQDADDAGQGKESKKKGNPRLAPDAVSELRFPKEEEITCADCVYRAKDIAGGKIKGATLGVCDAYPIKPPSVLLDGAKCMYYLSEDEEE